MGPAYTDPGASGQRADGGTDPTAVYYPELDRALQAGSAAPRRDTVVLTTDYRFLAFHPYRGFQQIAPQYANPHADYDARLAEISRWSQAGSPQELLAELDTSPWQPPTAFVMLPDGADGVTVEVSRDVFPGVPNVDFYQVRFPRALFDGPSFTTTTVGPWTVAVRVA